jgi:adenylate cyclase
MSRTRRLAAILAADVAGYSRLMGEDEEGTLAALQAIRRELGDPKIAEHHGRIVKTTGDGLLVEFASVVDAVRCAVEVQRENAVRNAGQPAGRRIDFRIGINVGDIIIEDDDIFGDGVNIAARLEALAEPGEVCLSAAAHDQVRDKLDFAFADMGEQEVKNIARPVHVFRIALKSPLPDPSSHAGEGSMAAAPAQALALPDKPSLAVLPFQNMSGDPEQEYFADGMVEEITTAISRLPWLFVIARNSSFTYKDRAVDVKQVAQELGVRYVLEGSVRKAGTRVRITGQLIDTASGSHIWADHFDGALDDIFDLQDRVAASVVGAIEPKLRLSEIERASRKPTDSLDAYDLYLRALAQTYRYHEQGLVAAIALARQALAIDPSYAPAAALVSLCHWHRAAQRRSAVSDADIAEAIRLARLAIAGARDDPETMSRSANALFGFAGEMAMAMTVVDRAVMLNPNAFIAWMIKGWCHALRNQPEPAIEALERARRLSPFDPLVYWANSGLAAAHLAAKRFGEAVEWAERALHDQRDLAPALRIEISALAHLGRLDAARVECARLLAIDPGFTVARFRALVGPGLAPEYLALLAEGLRLAGAPEGTE